MEENEITRDEEQMDPSEGELIAADWNSDAGYSHKPNGDAPDEDSGWDDIRPDTELAERKADQSFKLKHLGREFEASRDEVIALAQKGADYDRIRERADLLAEELRKNERRSSFFNEASALAGVPSDASAGDTGTAPPTPGGPGSARLAPNAAEAALRQAELKMHDLRKNSEIREFISEYKGVDSTQIPGEVWDEVKRGTSLLTAYRGYENRLLKAQLEAGKKDAENRSRTTGPRSGAGAPEERGELEADWYSDF